MFIHISTHVMEGPALYVTHTVFQTHLPSLVVLQTLPQVPCPSQSNILIRSAPATLASVVTNILIDCMLGHNPAIQHNIGSHLPRVSDALKARTVHTDSQSAVTRVPVHVHPPPVTSVPLQPAPAPAAKPALVLQTPCICLSPASTNNLSYGKWERV